jgi:sulfate transport system substrate-binding protein
MPRSLTTRLTTLATAAATAVTVAALSACGGPAAATAGSTGGSGGSQLSLVAYSTPQEAYKELIPAFQATPEGKGVTFTESYGASGAQTRAVVAGLKADVAALSLAPDIAKLVDAGLVAKDWDAGPQHGDVTRSVVVLVVRKGNPKKIAGWDDLVKPGVKVVTPNPLSSGGARWNVMAAYGAQVRGGKTPDQALAYLTDLFKHVAVQDASAATSLQTFLNGTGDVLISYENEAIAARDHGKEVEWVTPASTILIENPAAVLSSSTNATAAKAFVDFLRTPAAQKIFAKHGYRPVLPDLVDPATFPQPAQLFTIDDVGGWTEVSKKFFDPKAGLVVGVEKTAGTSLG